MDGGGPGCDERDWNVAVTELTGDGEDDLSPIDFQLGALQRDGLRLSEHSVELGGALFIVWLGRFHGRG